MNICSGSCTLQTCKHVLFNWPGSCSVLAFARTLRCGNFFAYMKYTYEDYKICIQSLHIESYIELVHCCITGRCGSDDVINPQYAGMDFCTATSQVNIPTLRSWVDGFEHLLLSLFPRSFSSLFTHQVLDNNGATIFSKVNICHLLSSCSKDDRNDLCPTSAAREWHCCWSASY